MEFNIPDKRSTNPKDYEKLRRLGRMKSSWKIGVDRQSDGKEEVAFNDGFTWGSIGQILGYLLGDVEESYMDDLYHKMFEQYEKTDHGKKLK